MVRVRPSLEIQFAEELAALQEVDRRPRPPQWQLSPWAVRTYLIGGTLETGLEITPKYIGSARAIEIAIATLVTDRALLLLGVPGTGKSWLSEHLSIAISGHSRFLVQGTAGTPEEALRYSWNYAKLLAQGFSAEALVASPVLRAMEEGAIVRIEELTRLPTDVQDSLLTILSEKRLPIPELKEDSFARQGFNLIATANQKDRGVNDLSTALKRRFNTVVLPLPATLEMEVEIVRRRVEALGMPLELRQETPILEEIRRVVTIFRELRQGMTEDGQRPLKSSQGVLSPADAISVVNQGLALAAHFGDGQLRAEDLLAGVRDVVVQESPQNAIAWEEYLETVIQSRPGWEAFYEAGRRE
ncbi:ATP-binding protein [Sodalinema gerasimenkoae]|uniref:ATP-binding protein n=1 Tax=Sodalinema gerasimenkoae TaxID=2862348 RepID=UPI00135815D5|nr:AAA family ATPase [Sodalinema gerasimenkoae]